MAAADDDVTRFADRLGRLKTRTDRSYAALARRLGMNASTLHRYCAGEAVPLDFAVVERFAALCGASAQERGELHRLWILAVAQRRRPRPSATHPQTPADDEPGVPEGGSEGGSEGGAQDSAQGGGADGRDGTPEKGNTPVGNTPVPLVSLTSPAPPTGPEPLTAPAPAPDTAAPRPRPDGPNPQDAPNAPGTPDAPPAANAVPGAGVLPTAGAERSSRAWCRRRPAVVFLLTAAGLLAFAALPGFPELPTQGSSDGAPPRGGRAASPTGVSARPSAPAVPFTWTVNSHVWEEDCGHDYVIGKPPRQVPPPPSAEDAEVWANAQDAVHGGETIVRVSVRGRSSAAVVLEALHVRVVRRAAPPGDGTFVYDTALGCGGGLTPQSFAVSLDAHTPVPRAVSGSSGDETLPARRLPYRVSVEDPEVLLVKARTKHCACDWYLDLDWSSQGRTGTIRIDDHGRPFRTAGIAGLPRYSYAESTRRWVPGSPHD
ncbi:helix-turn-helix domain-containing protein [Streptomyces sp. NPDC048404]|uniref:helix-turn-helix domain-containing protein n=1 Tax=unclassified Streptomyces TaxID=2593676 RepID=UPI00341A8DA8